MTITTTVHIEGDKMRVKHNRREGRLTKNIDKDRPHLTVRDTPILDAYEQLFGDAIREYNAKQKRKDRKIDGAKGYYHKLELDPRQHNVYEGVLTLGNKDTHLSYEDSEKIFLKFLEKFEKKFPNCHVIGFYIHGDEQGAIHAHIDFIPVAHQCKRGISNGVSMSGALAEMEIVPANDKNPMAIFTDKMREMLDECTREQKHNVKEHVHKDKVDRKNWLSTEAYAKMKDNARLDNERTKIEAGIEKNNSILKNQIEKYNHNKQVIKGQVDQIEEKEQKIKTLDTDIKTKSDQLDPISEKLNDKLIELNDTETKLNKLKNKIKKAEQVIKDIKPVTTLITFLKDKRYELDKEKKLKEQLKRLNNAGYNQIWNTGIGLSVPLSDVLDKTGNLESLSQNVDAAVKAVEDIKNGVYDDLDDLEGGDDD